MIIFRYGFRQFLPRFQRPALGAASAAALPFPEKNINQRLTRKKEYGMMMLLVEANFVAARDSSPRTTAAAFLRHIG